MQHASCFLFPGVPGVAGHGGADECVDHGYAHVALMEDAVHPLVGENVRRVRDGRG